MAAKKGIKLQVVADGIQVDGKWWHNGQQVTVSEAKANPLLKHGGVVKVS
jgi:hypothetical protein